MPDSLSLSALSIHEVVTLMSFPVVPDSIFALDWINGVGKIFFGTTSSCQ